MAFVGAVQAAIRACRRSYNSPESRRSAGRREGQLIHSRLAPLLQPRIGGNLCQSIFLQDQEV
jgi:hypothetical protein